MEMTVATPNQGRVDSTASRAVENSQNSYFSYEAIPTGNVQLWPANSLISAFIDAADDVCETPKELACGAFLPVVGRAMARRVFIPWETRRLYPNLFNIIVTPPGFRKSTLIRMAENVAREAMSAEAFFSGSVSDEALFDAYELEPDRLWIESEGNTILSLIKQRGYGERLGKRFLKLYDCDAWSVTFKSKQDESGNPTQTITENSTSIILGATLNIARFQGIEARDGLRRRFSPYLADKFDKMIEWPTMSNSTVTTNLASMLGDVCELEGEATLTVDAQSVWRDMQRDNRGAINGISSYDSSGDVERGMLAEEPTKILKRSMIFQAAKAVYRTNCDPYSIDAESLMLAIKHGQYCLKCSKDLETYGERAEIIANADVLLAEIRNRFRTKLEPGEKPKSTIVLDKTTLTSSFAHNQHRGRRDVRELYDKLLPNLESRELALMEKVERRTMWTFPARDGDTLRDAL